MTTRKVGILIFDEVEVLDFAGPFEVFGVTGFKERNVPFEVCLIAQEMRLIHARNRFAVMPHFSFETAPELDILIIPGGFGTRPLLTNQAVIEWLQRRASSTPLVLSVCTGALLLAKAGLLAGKSATTHHGAYSELRAVDSSVTVVEGVRLVDEGKIVTSGGVSAGIDMSLAVVSRLLGETVARQTAEYIEYPYWIA